MDRPAFDNLIRFFNNDLNIKVSDLSLLDIVILMGMMELIEKRELVLNNIPKKVVEDNIDVFNKYKIKYIGYCDSLIPGTLFREMVKSELWKVVKENIVRFDSRLYSVLQSLDTVHEKLKQYLNESALEYSKIYENFTNEDALRNKDLWRKIRKDAPKKLLGVISLINFDQLASFKDENLRPYQAENKRSIYKAWKQNKSIMLQMPTGTGKTRLFVSIVKDLFQWAKENEEEVNILILAHRKELINQISHNVGSVYGIPHGLIISNNIEQKEYPVQVGSVPTLNRRIDKWQEKEFDVIIIDEAHHVKASSYVKILNTFPYSKILGVTATPYRLNGVGFRPEFDKLIVSPSVYQFISDGYLCDYDYYSIKPDSFISKQIKNIKKFALDGDYLDSEMMKVVDRQEIRANIVDTYNKYAKGKKGIVYTINKVHNEHICQKLKALNVSVESIDSDTPSYERQRIVEDFKNGKVEIICNVNIFSEGFDCPDIEFILLARPTKSLALYLQQVGRGLRKIEGKTNVMILDMVGLYNRFGFPSAKRHWQYHFDGKYDKCNDNEIDFFSNEGVEDKNVSFIDTYDEGNEQVTLMHSSTNENEEEKVESRQKAAIPVLENKDSYNRPTKGENFEEIVNNCHAKIVELEQESKIFSKYNAEIPLEIQRQLYHYKRDLETYSKLLTFKQNFENMDWKGKTSNLEGKYKAQSLNTLIKLLNKDGYKIIVKVGKYGWREISFEYVQIKDPL